MTTESYGAFAYAYDEALGKRFFRAARKLLAQILDRYPASRKTHLDVACGTGLATEFFTSRGYRSVGVDASVQMLAIARRRGQRVVGGDFFSLPFREPFARITCLYDSLNHLKKSEELVAAFRAIRDVMSDESLFLFDMNHPDIYPEVWGMKEPFISDGPGYHLEIATTFRKRDAMGRALVTGWSTLGGKRVQIHERHEQRAYTEDEIGRALTEAGLVTVEALDFDPFHEKETLEARTVKVFFICRRGVPGGQ